MDVATDQEVSRHPQQLAQRQLYGSGEEYLLDMVSADVLELAFPPLLEPPSRYND